MQGVKLDHVVKIQSVQVEIEHRTWWVDDIAETGGVSSNSRITGVPGNPEGNWCGHTREEASRYIEFYLDNTGFECELPDNYPQLCGKL